MNIIRVQIGQEKVKDFVKEESEKLRQAAEEADINKLADDFEEQLKASREKLEADDQEFMDWEQKTAIKRNEGTFFQNLYRIKKELPGAQTAAAVNTEMQAQEAEQRAEAVEAAVQQTPPQSAIKLYVTSALTAVLSFAVVSDALSKSPSWGQDGVYIAVVLLLGLNLLSGKSKFAAAYGKALVRWDTGGPPEEFASVLRVSWDLLFAANPELLLDLGRSA
ncbi:TPA: hypothetical protein ACH3X1_001746 [Trebouxia sp. C0004]